MTRFTVVAFYTIGTPYEEEVRGLVSDCKSLQIPIETKGYYTRGSWVQNAGIKPEFLSEMRAKHNGPLVYLDADARIRKYPELFDELAQDPSALVGVHFRGGRELLSGTIYLADDPRAVSLLRKWVDHQRTNHQALDQKTLHSVIKKINFPVTHLPASYTQIFDIMAHNGEPVIEHLQASRRYRNKTTYPFGYFKGAPKSLRWHNTGVAWLPKANPKDEKILDSNMVKVGHLKWAPRVIAHDVAKLEGQHVGQVINITGKGPSLDNLTLSDLQGYPTICINQSILKLVALGKLDVYLIQQDRINCFPPEESTLILRESLKYYYPENPKKYLFTKDSLGPGQTPHKAVSVAALMGAKKIRMLGFDACVTGKMGYAKSTGLEDTHPRQDRFSTHRVELDERAKLLGVEIEWVDLSD